MHITWAIRRAAASAWAQEEKDAKDAFVSAAKKTAEVKSYSFKGDTEFEIEGAMGGGQGG
ncbi:MAG: hypothetical protein HY716_08325 [Planctomycetes bacterium]|nr:hypothetical protein [Planctomycetota bacterium]